jgi:hypothetical protein
MLTSRRDYLLRIIDEVGRLLAQLVSQRGRGRNEDALQSLALGFERLFGRDAHEVFQFTPEQQYHLLAEGEPSDAARDKRLLYAALSAEAARIYADLGRAELARASRLNALRFTLRARREFPGDNLPAFAPDPAVLLAELGPGPLDPETAELLRPSAPPPGSAPTRAQSPGGS